MKIIAKWRTERLPRRANFEEKGTRHRLMRGEAMVAILTSCNQDSADLIVKALNKLEHFMTRLTDDSAAADHPSPAVAELAAVKAERDAAIKVLRNIAGLKVSIGGHRASAVDEATWLRELAIEHCAAIDAALARSQGKGES